MLHRIGCRCSVETAAKIEMVAELKVEMVAELKVEMVAEQKAEMVAELKLRNRQRESRPW